MRIFEQSTNGSAIIANCIHWYLLRGIFACELLNDHTWYLVPYTSLFGFRFVFFCFRFRFEVFLPILWSIYRLVAVLSKHPLVVFGAYYDVWGNL